jgi:hypothetical protein
MVLVSGFSSIRDHLLTFAALSYVVVYHRHDIAMAGRTTLRGFKRVVLRRKELESDSDEADLAEDVHFRLMKAYPEVPEWWFGILLVISMVIGMLGVGVWPTDTTPAVVVYGIIMPLIAILPCGIVQMVTGIAIPLQVGCRRKAQFCRKLTSNRCWLNSSAARSLVAAVSH